MRSGVQRAVSSRGAVSQPDRKRAVDEIADTAIRARQDKVFVLMQEAGSEPGSTQGVTPGAGCKSYMVDDARPVLDAIAADGEEGDEAAVERRDCSVDAALHGERLDKAIVAFVPEFSRNHL